MNGALSALVDAVTRAPGSVETFIRGLEPSTWAMIGGDRDPPDPE